MGKNVWQEHAEAFGDFLRTQRVLAELTLRDLAERTNLSNAYLSQIERGKHQPSVRVLRALAEALDVSRDVLLAQAGLIPNPPAAPAESAEEDAAPPAPAVEEAIRADPRLTEQEKQALIVVYRSYVAGR